MPDRIAIAILNWNGQDLLAKYLPSVVAHSAEAKIYVIDNASEDDSLAYLEDHWPQLTVLSTPTNLGYAGGYNYALQEIPEELVVCLNSDVQVTANWLAPLKKAFHRESALAALQPKILALRKPGFFEYAGASGGYIDRLGYPFCRGRLFDTLEQDQGQYNDFQHVFWATGACLVVRRSAFLAVGGFNERLFAHMEEIDLCWRLQREGYSVAVEPASTVHHLGGATLAQSPRKTFLNFRNSLIVLFLNLPHRQALGLISLRLLLDGLAGLKFLLEGQPQHLWAILRAHFAFYRHFGALFAQKIGQRPPPLQNLSGVYRGSVVWDYFARGKKTFKDLYEDA